MPASIAPPGLAWVTRPSGHGAQELPSVIGSRDLCARQATVHIPLPVPQTTPDGQVFSSSAIFDNDEFMMAQHNTLPPELLGNWPVSNSYNWFGYLTANDDATLTVRNGSPAPLPTKVGPATARIGDVVSWTITIPLPAGDNYYDLGYRDVLPPEVEFVSADAPTCASASGANCTSDVGGAAFAPVSAADGSTTLGWWFGDIQRAAEDRTITIGVRARVRQATTVGADVTTDNVVTNRVQGFSNRVDSLGSPAVLPTTGFEFSSPVAQADTEVVEPKLSITKAIVAVDGSPWTAGPVAAGATVSYAVTVQNTGDGPAYDVPLSDTTDEAISSLTATGAFAGSVTKGWTAADPTIRWFLPTIAAGDTAVVTYDAVVSTDYPLAGLDTATNTATVARAWSRPDPELATDRSYPSVETSVDLPLIAPRLSLVKTGGAGCWLDTVPARPGGSVPFCLDIANLGSQTARDVDVTDVLPPEWDLDAAVPTTVRGIPATPTVSTTPENLRQVVWSVGDVAVGEHVIVTYAAIPGNDSPKDVTNRAVAVAHLESGAVAPLSARSYRARDIAAASLVDHALEVEKTPDDQRLAIGGTGGVIAWTIRVTNPGTEPLTDVRVTDVLPAPLTYAAGSASASPATGFSELSVAPHVSGGTQIVWGIASLASGATVDIALSANLAPSAGLHELLNHVEAVANEVPDAVANQALATVYAPASIGDRVWYDTDGDGIQDLGEAGVDGVSVTVTGTDMFGDAVSRTVTTSGGGAWVIDGLVPGEYQVHVVTPTGQVLSPRSMGTDGTVDSDVDAATGLSDLIPLASGETRTDVDAGVRQPPIVVGGVIFDDRSGDGHQDSDDSGLAGVVVTLLHGDGTPVLDPVTSTPVTTVTASDGSYRFIDLIPGTYRVAVATPTGYAIVDPVTSPAGTDSVLDPTDGRSPSRTTPAGGTDLSHNGGLFRPSSIGDTVWSDTDRDGVQDADESGVAGVTVTLVRLVTAADATVTRTTVSSTATDAAGRYTFERLGAGTYELAFTAPTGLVFTWTGRGTDRGLDSDADPSTGRTGAIDLAPGEERTDLDAGLAEPEVNLTLTKDLVGTATQGAKATYRLTVTNQGPLATQGNLTVTDDLPSGMTFVSGGGCSATASRVTCEVTRSLGVAESASIDLQVQIGASATGSLTNTASVEGQQIELTLSDNSDSATSVVRTASPPNSLAFTGRTLGIAGAGVVVLVLGVLLLALRRRAGHGFAGRRVRGRGRMVR